MNNWVTLSEVREYHRLSLGIPGGIQYCMIGLCLLMAGDESRIAEGKSHMTGDCCQPEGSIHRCVRTH